MFTCDYSVVSNSGVWVVIDCMKYTFMLREFRPLGGFYSSTCGGFFFSLLQDSSLEYSHVCTMYTIDIYCIDSTRGHHKWCGVRVAYVGMRTW